MTASGTLLHFFDFLLILKNRLLFLSTSFLSLATYQKAEILFYIGRFEEALVFYHTGVKQRPGMEMFHQGVRKAQEAIEVSLGGTVARLTVQPQDVVAVKTTRNQRELGSN